MNPLNSQPLDWSAIVQLRTMPRLTDLSAAPRQLFDNYYQIGPTEYVWAAYQWRDEDFSEQDVFISSVVWAPSFYTFQRMASRSAAMAAADDGISAPLPEPLRLAPHCTAYQRIRDFASRQGLRAHLTELNESENWLGSCFSVPRFSYYFRSRHPSPEELPYAARYDTRDERRLKKFWTPC